MTLGRAQVAAALLFSIAAAGCERGATPAECTALLDKYVELLLREQNPAVAMSEVTAKKELARDKASRDQSFAACPNEVGARELRCALGAPNVDEFEKCLE